MYVIQQEPRVFVVDDDAPVRRSLGRLLHTAGYEVELLAGAEAYLERAVPTRPACLLLDMRMPGMGGMELKHRITGTARELPVIFITAHGDEALRQALIRSGAVDVLFKPLDADVLLEAVARALKMSAIPETAARA
jgi:two-component system, LuxR family, response regulator FixJ